MKRLIRIAGFICAGLALVGVTGAIAIPLLSDRKQHRQVDVQVAAIQFKGASALSDRGKHLFETRGCTACHGANGEGHVVIKDSGSLFIKAPNIAAGSIVSGYRDADWIRLLRHGVKPAGTPVFVMPSEDYAGLTDEDVGALAGYVRSLPPAPAAVAEFRLPMLLKALYVFGVVRDAAEKIDHSLPPPATVPEGPTPQYGAYIATMCTGCHGPGFSGGKIPGTPPSWPAAANLTTAPDSGMSRYEAPEQFRDMMRSGKRRDGSAVSNVMPFSSLRRMHDVELDALFQFLKSTAPRTTGTR